MLTNLNNIYSLKYLSMSNTLDSNEKSTEMSKTQFLSRPPVILNISLFSSLACNHGNQISLVFNTLSGTLHSKICIMSLHVITYLCKPSNVQNFEIVCPLQTDHTQLLVPKKIDPYCKDEKLSVKSD